MKKSYLMTLVLAISVAFTGFASQPDVEIEGGEKYTLRYNPKKGTTGQMIMDYKMDINMSMMGQSMETAQSMEMGATMSIVENTGNEVKSQMKYDYVAMTMDNAMMGTMTYDSREDNTDNLFGAELGKAFDELIGKELNITQDKRGGTIDSDLADATGGQNSQGALNFSSIMGMSQFPENAIAVGESWSNTIDDAASPMKFSVKMTLKSVKNGKVYIDFESDVAANENFVAEETEEVEMEISGTQNGSFVYEEGTMWLIEGLISQDMDMTVEQMGMSIPMKLIGEMMLTVE